MRLPRRVVLGDEARQRPGPPRRARLQHPDGTIPWEAGRHADPWNQNDDSSWHSSYQDGQPSDTTRDSNYFAYIVVGIRHYWLLTRDNAFLTAMWPTVRSAIAFAPGRLDQARELLRDIQHLRHADGSYWTGYQYANNVLWPDERTTWTAGVVLPAGAVLPAGDVHRAQGEARRLDSGGGAPARP